MSENQAATAPVRRFPCIREMGDMQRLAHRQVAGFDVYHHIMAASWPAFFAMLAAAYVAFNFVFGFLYFIVPGSLANAKPGSIADVFFFSVHAMAAQGYRDVHAVTFYADLLGTGEVMCGMVMIAFITSLVFARFSRPKAGVVFSHQAVISAAGEEATLMMRVANQRNNLVIDAEATVMMTHDVFDASGSVTRRFEDIKLVRHRTPFWTLTWTLMHRIDKSSPLWGLTHEDLILQNAEICVAITGIDETLAVPVCGQHAYPAEEILWNSRFADVFSWSKTGRFQINFSQLHKTVATSK
jgi:inward rectifier potassium channel